MQQNFDDRFTYNNALLAATNVDTITDDELETLSPDVRDYAAQVRRHSVILGRKATAKLIYKIATEDSDPRIALRLAAGRRKSDNERIFPSLEAVKEAMFGPPSDTSDVYLSSERNIFVGGIRRVSAALTASRLIGQLAQVEEQAKHANVIEAQALADLKEILYTFSLENSSITKTQDELTTTPAIYFEPTTINLDPLGNTLKVEVYVSEGISTGWHLVNDYNQVTSTGAIAADISNTLNSLALTTGKSNVLAAPILAARGSLHKIDFQARRKDPEIAFEVITIRVTSSDGKVPFKWGIDPEFLKNERINSALISVANGRASTTATAALTNLNKKQPTVLYFRRAIVDSAGFAPNNTPRSIWQSAQVKFRISPSMSELATLNFETPTVPDPIEQARLDAERPGRLAELLLNALVAVKGETKALGALIRNDDPITSSTPLSALELIAFCVTDPETWLILDVMDLPADIEMATGNVFEPLTPFSSMPRSIRVESTLETRASKLNGGGAGDGSNTYNGEPLIQKLPPSAFLAEINEKAYKGRSYRNLNLGMIGYNRHVY